MIGLSEEETFAMRYCDDVIDLLTKYPDAGQPSRATRSPRRIPPRGSIASCSKTHRHGRPAQTDGGEDGERSGSLWIPLTPGPPPTFV